MWGPCSIAKLVQITPIAMIYGTYNSSFHGVYKSGPTLYWWVYVAWYWFTGDWTIIIYVFLPVDMWEYERQMIVCWWLVGTLYYLILTFISLGDSHNPGGESRSQYRDPGRVVDTPHARVFRQALEIFKCFILRQRLVFWCFLYLRLANEKFIMKTMHVEQHGRGTNKHAPFHDLQIKSSRSKRVNFCPMVNVKPLSEVLTAWFTHNLPYLSPMITWS